MPSLKEYRNRIASVKSTRKITSAMKMVAASKLKKAQEKAEATQPYARAMDKVVQRVAGGVIVTPSSPKLLAGTGRHDVHLLVVVTSDRGLAGGFNANLVRTARAEIRRLSDLGKTVKLVTVGRKARDLLRRDNADKILQSFVNLESGKFLTFADTDQVTRYVLSLFEEGAFDVCSLVYNHFVSVLSQKPEIQQIIPLSLPDRAGKGTGADVSAKEGSVSPYTFEPEQDALLDLLLPKNVATQIFRALLDSAAGEQAARMTAMDNATRNAGDIIKNLTIQYNRARQAYITKELIEIISGAEAL